MVDKKTENNALLIFARPVRGGPKPNQKRVPRSSFKQKTAGATLLHPAWEKTTNWNDCAQPFQIHHANANAFISY